METPQGNLEFKATQGLRDWMVEHQVSLGFTTYQAGKLFLIGVNEQGTFSFFERTFERCMGLYSTGRSLYMASVYQIWRFENVLEPEQQYNGYDACYVPQVGYTTGDVDTHDIVVDGEGRLLFVNTLFSCLGQVSHTHSFKSYWKPPFVSDLKPEDRCHLNGVAVVGGEATYVTSASEADVAEGWRGFRDNGGIVMDIRDNRVLATGLSMPHSPRFHNGNLYLHQSGKGEFGMLDRTKGEFQTICTVRGYPRGLALIGDFAVIGVSRLRANNTLSALPIAKRLYEANQPDQCAILVVDLKKGVVVHAMEIQGFIDEIYDVVALPGVRRPMLIGFRNEEIRKIISIET